MIQSAMFFLFATTAFVLIGSWAFFNEKYKMFEYMAGAFIGTVCALAVVAIAFDA